MSAYLSSSQHVKAESAEASNGMTNRDRQSGGSSNRAPQYTDSRGRDHSRDSRGGGGGLPPPDRSHHRSSGMANVLSLLYKAKRR